MPQDMRTFLEYWKRSHPDEVITISKEVSAKWEITALQTKINQSRGEPILIFEKPVKVDGKVSPHELVTGIFVNRRRTARMIGSENESVAKIFVEKTSRKLQPTVIGKREAPVKEVIDRDNLRGLDDFPVVWHADLDPGPYIGMGLVTTYDPETGIHNSSLQRCWVKSRKKWNVYIVDGTHNWLNMMKFWNMGQDAPVAVWIGHHPAVILGSMIKTGYPDDHYPYAGGLLGESLRLVPTETFGEKLLVPADAEVVVEGLIRREQWEAEGPFAEYHGYQGPQRPSFVIEVKSVTHRGDAIWHDLLTGGMSYETVGGVFTTEAVVYDAVKKAVPEVLDVRRPAYGLNLYIKLRVTRPGLARPAIMAALAARPLQVKYVFIFDEDINIFDDSQILWAFATRTQLDRDLVLIPNSPTQPLDPTSPGDLSTVAGFDCTRPIPTKPGLHPPFAPVTKVPDEVLQKIKAEDYIR